MPIHDSYYNVMAEISTITYTVKLAQINTAALFLVNVVAIDDQKSITISTRHIHYVNQRY